MLENFTNEEIEELLDTGSLYRETPGESDRWIKKQPAYNLRGDITGSYYEYNCRFDDISMPYQKLYDLLLCEHIMWDDIRAHWRYHGVLLDSPKFQEKVS